MAELNTGMTLGALLIDLENFYFALRDEYEDSEELTVRLLNELRDYLRDKLHISPVVGRAYAPFDYSSSRHFINDMALMGITPVHVLAKPEKSSADLMLAIDCMELLFRRSDIDVFVVVGGDRDYIPVAERIRQNAKRVLIVSPRQSMSGDLLTIIGTDSYIDPVEIILANDPPTKKSPEPSSAPVVEATAVPKEKVDGTSGTTVQDQLSMAPGTVRASKPISTPKSMDELESLSE